jgi:hypothetical protein
VWPGGSPTSSSPRRPSRRPRHRRRRVDRATDPIALEAGERLAKLKRERDELGLPKRSRRRELDDLIQRQEAALVGSVGVTAVDGALPLDGGVGLDALYDSHVEVTEVLDLVLGLDAGVALALTLLFADAPLLALLAHLRLAVQLRERRLVSASQG